MYPVSSSKETTGSELLTEKADTSGTLGFPICGKNGSLKCRLFKRIWTKASSWWPELTHPLPYFQHSVHLPHWTRKVTELSLLLKQGCGCRSPRMHLGTFTSSSSCGLSPQAINCLPYCPVAIVKALRMCRRCIGVIFNGKDRF